LTLNEEISSLVRRDEGEACRELPLGNNGSRGMRMTSLIRAVVHWLRDLDTPGQLGICCAQVANSPPESMRAWVEEEAWSLGASRALKMQRGVRTKHPETLWEKPEAGQTYERSHQLQKGGTDADLADYRNHDEAEDRGD
jgi:hypothetical protein